MVVCRARLAVAEADMYGYPPYMYRDGFEPATATTGPPPGSDPHDEWDALPADEWPVPAKALTVDQARAQHTPQILRSADV